MQESTHHTPHKRMRRVARCEIDEGCKIVTVVEMGRPNKMPEIGKPCGNGENERNKNGTTQRDNKIQKRNNREGMKMRSVVKGVK